MLPMAVKPRENFEKSLTRLEEIVRKLEEGEVSLEESLKVYEEGMKLVQLCEARLNEFQKKVEVLKKREGKLVTEEFEES